MAILLQVFPEVHPECEFFSSLLGLPEHARIAGLLSAACRYADLMLVLGQELGRATSSNTFSISRGHQILRQYAGSEDVQLAAQSLFEALRALAGDLYLPIKWIFQGESETEFFPVLLRARHGERFRQSRVLSMTGSGNVKNLRLLLRAMKKDGYEPLIVTDRLDSPLAGEVEKLRQERLLHGKNVFAFKRDFESSFPPRLLTEAFISVAGEEFASAIRQAAESYLSPSSKGFIRELEENLRKMVITPKEARERVDSWKVPVAQSLAEKFLRHFLPMLSGQRSGEPEISRAIRMVVRDVNWFKGPA